MKSKMLSFGASLLMVLLCGCGTRIENDIVFICNQQQYNDNYVNKGYFIDRNGDKGYFDLSGKGMDYANINMLYSYLTEYYSEFEKVPFMEESNVRDCYAYLNQVDISAPVEEECVMTDYGSYIFYGIRLSEESDAEVIMLEERINSSEPIRKIATTWLSFCSFSASRRMIKK